MHNNLIFKVTDMFHTLDVILQCNQKSSYEDFSKLIQKTVSSTIMFSKEIVDELRTEKERANRIAERLLFIKLHDFLSKCNTLLQAAYEQTDKKEPCQGIQHIDSLIQEVKTLSQMPHLKLVGGDAI